MRLGRGIVYVLVGGFPRVSGDAPWADISSLFIDAFSPRERGCAPQGARVLVRLRVFPA